MKHLLLFVLLSFTILFGFTQNFQNQGAGVTIIVHGWNPDGDLPLWLEEMSNAIAQRAGGNVHNANITVTGTFGNLSATCSNWDFNLESDSYAEIIVIVNWTAIADHLTSGIPAQQVAAAIAPRIYQSQNGKAPLSELPIHLIGHSRGAGMVFEIARLLGLQGIDVDQITSLDPHPLTAEDPQGLPPPLGPGSTIDSPISIFENVLFVDNYWQNIEYPKGQYLDGAYNRLWTTLSGGYHNETGYTHTFGATTYNFSDHLNIILAYHGTIDLATPVSNGEATMDTDERQWFNAYENQGENAGFLYSRIGMGNRSSTDEPVVGGDKIIDGLHNDATIGGQGNRNSINWASSNWSSIISSNISLNSGLLEYGSYFIDYDDEIIIDFNFRSYNEEANITWYLDIDRNPYNNNNVFSMPVFQSAETLLDIVAGQVNWTVSGIDEGVKYYIYAEIDNGIQVRYYYTNYEFEIEAPEQNLSLHFDGTNDYVEILQTGNGFFGDNSDNDDFTIEFWFRTNEYDNLSHILSKHSNFFSRKGMSIESDGFGSIRAAIANSSDTWVVLNGLTETIELEWYHVALNYESNTGKMEFYINSILQSSIVVSDPVFDDIVNMRIGGSEYYSSISELEIDELRFWNTIRTQCELHSYMNTQLSGSEEGLIAYYKFNQGSPGQNNTAISQLIDASVNELHADLHNFTLDGPISNFVLSTAPISGVNELNPDTEDPVIVSTHEDVFLSANNDCYAALPDFTTEVEALDNCTSQEDLIITQNPLAGTLISGSINEIIISVEDEAGNIAQVSFNAEVIDETAPVIISIFEDEQVFADENCEGEVPDFTIGLLVEDNCSNFNNMTITQTPVIGTIISGDTNQITLRAEDEEGNFSEIQFNLLVVDNLPPVPNIVELPELIAECEIAELSVPTATDNCDGEILGTHNGELPISISQTIIWTYQDAANNISTQEQQVIIQDNTAPAPDLASLPDIFEDCELLELIAPTATDNCYGTINGVHDAEFPIQATTIVIWTYQDDNGNISSQTQNVIIEDNEAPIPDLSELPDIVVECMLESVVAPTASDNCSGIVVGTHNAELPINQHSVITWTYEDDNGNTSSQTQNVIISDTEPPIPDVLNLPDIVSDCEVTELTPPTATDNCSGLVEGSHNATLPIINSQIVLWTYIDDNGNSSEQEQNVIIEDNDAPFPDIVQLPDIFAECEVNELTIPTATDNCAGIVYGTHNADLPITTQGSHVLTWYYEDNSGNTNSQNQNIIISDNTDPVIVCPDDFYTMLDYGVYSYEVQGTEFDPDFVDDNCEIETISNNLNFSESVEGENFPIGTSVLVWTVTDYAANTASCSIQITVDIYTKVEVAVADYISIYPNPAKDYLTISVDLEGISTIKIIDVSGRIVKEIANFNTTLQIDISELNQGMYIIEITNNNLRHIVKFIKE